MSLMPHRCNCPNCGSATEFVLRETATLKEAAKNRIQELETQLENALVQVKTAETLRARALDVSVDYHKLSDALFDVADVVQDLDGAAAQKVREILDKVL